MKKRGISTVIVNLIIILLVLVAVGILWAVLKNLITGGTEEVSLEKFTVDMKISSVLATSSTTLNIGVKRNPGEAEIAGIMVFFEGSGKTDGVEKIEEIDELSERTFIIYSTELLNMNIGAVEKISIIPIFKSRGENKKGNIADKIELSCSDSDGANRRIKGIVKTPLNTYTDYCIDNSRVMEYYCVNSIAFSYSEPCTGCINGACSV